MGSGSRAVRASKMVARNPRARLAPGVVGQVSPARLMENSGLGSSRSGLGGCWSLHCVHEY